MPILSIVHNVDLPPPRSKILASRLSKHRAPISTTKTASGTSVEVVCISDTHGLQPEIPQADILIHAGDLTAHGTFDEVQAQLTWLSSQPHQHKIVIAGNHDFALDSAFLDSHPQHRETNLERSKADFDFGNLTYLEDEAVTINVASKGGKAINIYGSPWTPEYGIFAFQYPRKTDRWTNQVPPDTDILVIHGPPAGHLDAVDKRRKAGCAFLLQEIRRVRPQLVVFGHIHIARGQEDVAFDRAQVLYEDIMADKRGKSAVLLLGLAVLGTHVRRVLRLRPSKVTKLVNAAVMDGMKKDVALPAITVTI